MEDSDSETDLECLFKEKDTTEDLFYFKEIIIEKYQENDVMGTLILFKYAVNGIIITSKMVLDGIEYNKNMLLGSNYKSILSIGMCILPWYWMGFVTKRIIIEPAVSRNMLTQSMITFWETLYNNVLLEFLYVYRNLGYDSILPFHIEVDNIQNESIIDQNVSHNVPFCKLDKLNSIHNNEDIKLVPLGGGKDSLVAWHMAVKEGKTPVFLYLADTFREYESNHRVQNIVSTSKTPVIIIRHNFHDENMYQYSRSFITPCGHPWAALVLFDSLLISNLLGFKDVSLGFEKSADEGNRVYVKGIEVNHQYDKSSKFLNLATSYIHSNINDKINISSSLNQMWELEICRIFCEAPELKVFHNLFLSCNQPIKIGGWCGVCEKCIFIFLLLSSFLEPEKVNNIFGQNYFENEKLLPIFLSLLVEENLNNDDCVEKVQKPFECVGTTSEASAAIHLSLLQYVKKSINISYNQETTVFDSNCINKLNIPIVLFKCCELLNIDLNENGYPVILTHQEVIEKWELN